ncbi:MAG: hypothetical protein AAGK05_17945 [Pseudomonadota bacterium]
MKSMAFIRKFIKPRATSSNVSCTPLSQELTHSEDEGTLEKNEFSDTENIPVSNSRAAAPTKRRKTSALNSVGINELLNIVKEPIPTEKDEDELFCLSLAPSLKRMTARNRSKAKMKVLEIMDEYEFNQLEIPSAPVVCQMPSTNSYLYVH